MSPQPSCGDICQIWMWFKESNRYFCKIQNFACGEINERNFSNPQPWGLWRAISLSLIDLLQAIYCVWIWRKLLSLFWVTLHKIPLSTVTIRDLVIYVPLVEINLRKKTISYLSMSFSVKPIIELIETIIKPIIEKNRVICIVYTIKENNNNWYVIFP